MAAATTGVASAAGSAEDTRTVDEMSLFEVMREDAHAALERDPAASSIWDIVFYSTGTHIVWATGGSLVPEEIWEVYRNTVLPENV